MTLLIELLDGEGASCESPECVRDKVPGSDAREALEGVWYMLLLNALLGAVLTVPVLELLTCVNLDPGLVGPDPENVDRRWWICDEIESKEDVRLVVDGCEKPSPESRRDGSRPVIPVRRDENVDIKALN